MNRLQTFLKKELRLEDSAVYKKFEQYNELLMDWNEKINLVSRKQENIENNIVNSIFFLTKYKMPEKFSLADIGTGGGFPGIPLKIIYPDSEIICVDSIAKKIMVVNDVIEKMNLKKISAVTGRGEEIGKKKEFSGKYDFVTAKAVAPVKEVMKFGRDFLNAKGKYILIKGGDITEELQNVKGYKIINFDGMEEYGVEDKKLVVV